MNDFLKHWVAWKLHILHKVAVVWFLSNIFICTRDEVLNSMWDFYVEDLMLANQSYPYTKEKVAGWFPFIFVKTHPMKPKFKTKLLKKICLKQQQQQQKQAGQKDN